jgi:hypothetical protein
MRNVQLLAENSAKPGNKFAKNFGKFTRNSCGFILTACLLPGILTANTTALGSASSAQTATCQARSGVKTTALLELFTSEGCSSCPPAEKWHAGIKSSASVIPLAWHVDYWDRLGWKDRFAHPYATERQRAVAALEGSRNIYTPQSAVHSRSIYHTESAAIKARLEQTNAQNSTAVVSVQAEFTANKTVAVKLSIDTPDSAARGFVALVEDGLVSNVRSGENSGATLRHDHVVRQFAGPFSLGANGSLNQSISLVVPPDSNPARLSLVAWAETARGQVLQSVKLEPIAACKLALK